ncbi:MAG: hypothetical protein JWR24_4050 [Actinoallomurus sp.]|nr:hypothetical protein [Actinoallomurus sp.]
MATLTDTWEPANQLEQQLRDALRDGDQDAYFAQVSQAELFVPLPPGEAESVMADQTAFTWPTSTREGRTHVLAYTSGEAARACLGDSYQHSVRMSLADMARSWPDQEWWLALNSGLPIEGYLPAWFIGQLTAGIVPMVAEVAPVQDAVPPQPVQGSTPPAPMPEAVPPASAHDSIPPMPDGLPPAPGQNGMPPVATADSMPPPPVPDGVPPAPPHDSIPPMPEGVAPAPASVHDSIPPMPDGLPPAPGQNGMAPVATPDSMPPPPPPDLTPRAEVTAPHDVPFGVDRAPITLHITQDAEFAPLDDEERALYEAAARGDRETFLRTLLGVRQIWVPIVEGGDLMLGPGRAGFQWYVEESAGRPTVPFFTGPGRMREAMGGHPFVLSDLAKVLRFWPDSGWDLVVNAGTPIGASIAGERITAMSHQVDAEAAARLASDFPAQSDAERQMFDARSDPEMLLKVLLDTSVFLPVWSRTPPAVQTPPGDPSFPWSAVPVRGRPSVLAFTSFDWMKAAVGTTGFVMPTFADLLAAWPEQDWSVSVNPGTPIEAALSGEQIRTLIGLTADRPRAEVPSAAEPPRLQTDAPPPAEPAQIRTDVPPPADGPQFQGESPQEHSADDAADVPDAPAGPWTIMQKVVPHDQVSWYLDQAYDRVAGFVHRVQDVIELGTPGRLYESLGLLRDGSAFNLDDAEVHVIRWPAYRSGLYRTPLGGQAEEALQGWGEGGWVVEAPPFQGDGFAPGSGGSIREYKIDSLRLPHGSEMYTIGRDGAERFTARYDADRMVWGDSE